MLTKTPDESLYRALVQASPDAFMFSDFSGKIRIANPRAAEMGGFDNTDELTGLNLFDFVTEKDKLFITESFEKLARNVEKGAIEATLIRKDGSTYDAELTGSVIRDDNKTPIGLITITRDITNRKALENVLARAKDNADKDNHLKDAFISNISHEIRTPLNAIAGFTDLIREELEEIMSEEIGSYFSIIDLSCNRLIQGVEMILNLSRLQTRMFTLEKKPVNPDLILVDLVARHRQFALQKSLSLVYDNQCGAVQLMTDVNCFSQPISIILDNAIKYTKKGSVKVTMRADSAKGLSIEIADTGIGMHPDYLSRIFEPFSQEETGYTRNFSGLGLSLAVARKLIETIGGEITVESRQGEGSAFTITLPVT